MVWVNLLPWREQLQAKRRRGWLLVAMAILLPGAAVIPGIYQQLAAERGRWQQQLIQQQAAIAGIDGLLQRLAQQQQQRQALLARQQQQQRLQQRNQQWQQFAQVLPELMPATLWLTSLQQGIAGLHISGICHEVAEVNAFRQQLSQQPLFQQVSHGSIQRQQSGTLQFSLQAEERQNE